MKFKTNFVFKSSWLFLMHSWFPTNTWMWTNSGNQLPSTSFKGGRCETSKGVNYVVYWWWMQRRGCETKEVGGKPTCYCLTFMCCQPCLPNFQCFQSCVSWTPFCIFSFCYFSYAVVSGTLPWVARANLKLSSRLAEYDDVIRGPPFSVLPRASPTLNPPHRWLC